MDLEDIYPRALPMPATGGGEADYDKSGIDLGDHRNGQFLR